MLYPDARKETKGRKAQGLVSRRFPNSPLEKPRRNIWGTEIHMENKFTRCITNAFPRSGFWNWRHAKLVYHVRKPFVAGPNLL